MSWITGKCSQLQFPKSPVLGKKCKKQWCITNRNKLGSALDVGVHRSLCSINLVSETCSARSQVLEMGNGTGCYSLWKQEKLGEIFTCSDRRPWHFCTDSHFWWFFKKVVLLGGLICIPCIDVYCIWLQQQQWSCWGMGSFFKDNFFFQIFLKCSLY